MNLAIKGGTVESNSLGKLEALALRENLSGRSKVLRYFKKRFLAPHSGRVTSSYFVALGILPPLIYPYLTLLAVYPSF